jgi:hypothetical protein
MTLRANLTQDEAFQPPAYNLLITLLAKHPDRHALPQTFLSNDLSPPREPRHGLALSGRTRCDAAKNITI